MVSSLIGPQYHETQFWKFAQSAQAGDPNDFSVAMVPTFAADFEVRSLDCNWGCISRSGSVWISVEYKVCKVQEANFQSKSVSYTLHNNAPDVIVKYINHSVSNHLRVSQSRCWEEMPLVGRLICVFMAWKTCTSNPKAFCNDCYVQYAHFHGTEDGAIKYDGQNPGPAFLNNAEVIAAQLYVKTIEIVYIL